MLRSVIYTLLLFVCTQTLVAQDAYHSELQRFLQTEYNAPAGEWLFFDNENAILAAATHYGVSATTLNAQGQDFTKKEVINVGQAGNNPWDAGWSVRNSTALAAGEVVLATFYLRSTNGGGEVRFFLEDGGDFSKEVYLTINVTDEWRRYFIPVTLQRNYGVNTMVCGFHLATQAQELELGGFTALNFGDDIDVDNLPNDSGNQFYGGFEADAAWRAPAAERIAQLRKADLTIQTVNVAGEAVGNVPVQVSMLAHDFGWGTAIKASHLAGNNDYNLIYESKLTDLDGRGHGFNAVVFENDLKWPAWEEEWLVNKAEMTAALCWIADHDLRLRGHTLVWPGNENLPTDIRQNLDDVDYIKNRINEHIETIMTYPKMQSVIEDWDVLNEIVTNTTLANRFRQEADYATGRELYVEIFNKAKEVDPAAGLYLNDYITLSVNQQAGSTQYDELKQFVGELVAAGAPIDGIGFQGHIGGAPNSIYSVLETLDDFYDTYGLRAKITEFDLPTFVDEELAATYLRDFMTAIYSHPSMDAFLFWSFWDGATWMNAGSNLYRQDWSATPAHAAFTDLLFNEWWTNTQLVANESGTARENVFKGKYEISYVCAGQTIRDTIDVREAMSYTITCDELASSVTEVETIELRVFPNPTADYITLVHPRGTAGIVQLTNLQGQIVYTKNVAAQRNVQIEVPQTAGVYYLQWQDKYGTLTQKLVIE